MPQFQIMIDKKHIPTTVPQLTENNATKTLTKTFDYRERDPNE